jgi:hypothetical protein
MISLPRLSPRFPVFLVMARNQASLLQHGSMAKIKIASVNVMQQSGIRIASKRLQHGACSDVKD